MSTKQDMDNQYNIDEVIAVRKSIAHNFRLTQRYMMRSLENRIKLHGISFGHWFFLRVLWEEDGISQTVLSERAGVVGPTTVNAVKRMEQMGLIRRKSSLRDRRKTFILLTAKGTELRDLLLPGAAEVMNIMFSGLSFQQVADFEDTMHTVMSNLKKDLCIVDESTEASDTPIFLSVK